MNQILCKVIAEEAPIGAPAIHGTRVGVSSALIPNNVDLDSDPRLKRALEAWRPRFLEWWDAVGPQIAVEQVYLRTAISVEGDGWAHYDHVRPRDYRWGIFQMPHKPDRTIGFGDNYGRPAWQVIPGDLRNTLRRLIVTQGDTEPASVEQQRFLGRTAPSLADLRSLLQVNVEEARHLLAMVHLLHGWFGRDGRDEAEELLARRSGDADRPRILGAFNQPIQNWLDFYMFTMFTDRDGKFQLHALSESGFDPVARTCEFMLTEESYHMSVGVNGVERIVERSVQLAKADPNGDARVQGGIDLVTIQKYIDLWFSLSLDLFGSEESTNAANFFAAGLKGRYHEGKHADHLALEGSYPLDVVQDGRLSRRELPYRNALNAVLADEYIVDCQKGVDRWNKVLEREGLDFRFRLPSRRFNRRVGLYAGLHFDPDGNLITPAEWENRNGEWLPTPADAAYVASIMQQPVYERGKIAHWISPPRTDVNKQPWSGDFVRF